LLNQWREEIVSKTEENYWRVLIHHGPTKARTAKELFKYDIVLTTYHTLAGEWPDEETAIKKSKKGKKKKNDGFVEEDESDGDDFVKLAKPGVLFQGGFFRVVLDEARTSAPFLVVRVKS
jgi:SNF2 family DNA or RNA helicase